MSSSCATIIQVLFSWTLVAVVSTVSPNHGSRLISSIVGNDVRKAVVDGWPVQNVIASDLREGQWSPIHVERNRSDITIVEFWQCGHELFNSTPETFPAVFIPGDVFGPEFIEPHSPFYEKPQNDRPALKSLVNSLTPMQGHISVIHASSFFHLFNDDGQLEVAQRLASLLSPAKGSIIFGSHVARPEKGWQGSDEYDERMFCHSPESWKELWDGQVFERGTVKVVADIHTIDTQHGRFFLMRWSVTKV